MATTTTISTTDDLTGEEGAETVTFEVEGQRFEIDLTPANRDDLVNRLRPFIDNGRRLRNGMHYPGKQRPAMATQRDYDLTQLRAWASAHDVKLPARGRVPAAIVEQYKKWSTDTARRESRAKRVEPTG